MSPTETQSTSEVEVERELSGRIGVQPAEPAAPPRQSETGTRPNGRSRELVEKLAGRQAGWKKKALLALGAVALVAGIAVGYRWWYDSVHFVSTDNAQVGGFMVQVGTLEAGRVASVRFDLGDRVQKDDVVANLYTPQPRGLTPSGQPKMEFQPTQDSLVEVRSPLSGVIVARSANPGDTVPLGQSLITVVDPQQLWINANIDEAKARRLRPGQPATINVDLLGTTLTGRVVALSQATAATFSLLPSKNVSGNFTREVQYVPVKIALDRPEPRLVLGSSVEVRIRVLD